MTIKISAFKILGGLILAGLSINTATADVSANHPEAEKLEKQLFKANTSSDSIKILLDVYAMSDMGNKERVRMKILDLAQDTNNNDVISDVVRELSTSTDDATELAQLIELSESLEDEEEKQSLQTVLIMEHANAEASNVKDSAVEKAVAEYAMSGMDFDNPYTEIQNIYTTMVYLGASSQGPLYLEYIKRLEELVDELPDKDYAIKNLYFTTAALFYTRKRDYAKAIYFDRKLIKELNAMEKAYDKKGITDYDLDYFYYVSYRRMLRNFKGLTPEEIEETFHKTEELAAKDERVQKEFGTGGLTKSYYFMATGQYANAVPELKKALSAEGISNFRRQELLGLLAQAQRETGDKNGELQTLRDYTRMMLAEREERKADFYREIEIRNSVNKLLAEETHKQDKQRQSNKVMRKTSLTLVYVLGVILIFLFGAYMRLRRRVKELESKNTKLRTNIEHIFDDGVPRGTTDLRHNKNRLKG